MLTELTIRNFKRFGEVEIDLVSPVLFIGPDNSGETSAVQALTLWNVGLMRWNEKRSGKSTPEKRPGVTINRRELVDCVPDSEIDPEIRIKLDAIADVADNAAPAGDGT